jgi:hypothetical protein
LRKTETHPNFVKRSFSLIPSIIQVKELVDTPERIWAALEQHNYVQASDMYLQAYALHDDLVQGANSTQKLMVKQQSIIKISKTKQTILKKFTPIYRIQFLC